MEAGGDSCAESGEGVEAVVESMFHGSKVFQQKTQCAIKAMKLERKGCEHK